MNETMFRHKYDTYYIDIEPSEEYGFNFPFRIFIPKNLVNDPEIIYAWNLPIVIKKENRLDYYKALDKAHTTCDYNDFINLVIDLECEMLNNYLQAL